MSLPETHGPREPQKWVQPVGPSYAAPSTVTPSPSRTSPTTCQPGGTDAGSGKVASRAWSSPPERMNWSGSAPSAAPTACSGSGTSKAPVRTSIATPLASARCPASASRPSEMSMSAVAPASAACLAGGVRRLRAAVGLDEHPRRAEAAAQDGQPAGGPALAAGEREHVAGLGARAQHRRLEALAEHGHRDHDLVGPGDVAADHGRPDDRALLGEAAGEVERPRDRAGPRARPGRWSGGGRCRPWR